MVSAMMSKTERSTGSNVVPVKAVKKRKAAKVKRVVKKIARKGNTNAQKSALAKKIKKVKK